MQVKVAYLYRDAGNYKNWGDLVFSNPEMLNVEEIESRIRRSLFDGFLFIARQIDVPDLFLYTRGQPTTDDHCFHEIDTISETEEMANDCQNRTIFTFIQQIERIGRNGWKVFDPISRDI
jgi:hypothetical protein